MQNIKIILKYFPDLQGERLDQLTALEGMYQEWNAQINVISRKDIDQLYVHHVLHSLAIAKFINFKDGSKILDLGTGGGFPGIPLAIFFPEVEFTLVDGIGKKIKVVNEVAMALGLKNVKGIHGRAEELKEKYDFVVTRAVAKVDMLLPWARKVLAKADRNIYPNGLIALKGDVKEEIKLLPKYEYTETKHVFDYFQEPFFEEKYILYVQG
jgi:16S rRNA (guanine527-N7)-methyltransferase